MTRSNARELAVHVIYSCGFLGEAPEQVLQQRLNREYYETLSREAEAYEAFPNRSQKKYIREVVLGVVSRQEALNGLIQRFSIGWDVSRISRLTRAILQTAIFEILSVQDVPTGAAIAEAVRLAKCYDGQDTGAFVNGILGSFARSLENGSTE